jgi:hypothetical protein
MSNTDAKIIRIIDGRYNLQFTVQDGGHIRDAEGKVWTLHYLDETHFRLVGPSQIYGTCYHICEFGEKVIDRGTVVEKVDAQDMRTPEA